jgi:hypothetical protein
MKDFIPYNESLELKELGFDEESFGLFPRSTGFILKWIPNQQECEEYFGGILAPTFSQAFRFFREKYNLFSSEVYDRGLNNGKIPVIHSYSFRILNLNNFEDFYGNIFNTYEEAELACLIKLIQIVKQQKL